MKTMRLPDFLIIGAMKSGTTTLYRDLLTNPLIYFPIDKEPDHLTNDRVLTSEGRREYAALFARARADQICGEASTLSTKLPQFPGVPRRARQLLGSRVKLIYIVRNPLERTISHHWHEYSRGRMPPTLGEALDTHPELIAYSQYAMQAGAWLEHFERERLSIIVFEEFVEDRQGTIERLSRFLGVPPRVDQVEVNHAFNVSGATGVARGRWARLVAHPLYRKIMRPLLPHRLRDALRGALLPKAPPKPARPSRQTVRRIIDAVADDADRLRRLLGRDQPLWDFEAVLEATTGAGGGAESTNK